MKTNYQTHDLALPAWGPYTKKYMGISHIPAANDGVRFDLSVFPGMYRRRVDVPDVRFESGYHVWAAAPDLSCYTIRYELEWKDRVYADISFASLHENVRLIRAELHNCTDISQNLVLHYMASACDPIPSYRNFPITGCDVKLPEKAAFLLAKEYDDLRFAVPRFRDSLGYDGMRRAEDSQEGFVAGYCIGQNFGCAAGKDHLGQSFSSGKGDWVCFTMNLNAELEKPVLGIRYMNPSEEASVYILQNGQILTLPPAVEPRLAFFRLEGSLCAGSHTLELTAEGKGCAKLDCFVLCEEEEKEAVRIIPRANGHCPEIRKFEAERFITLKYAHIQEVYGVAWDFCLTQLREIENDELDIFLRDTVHDHVNSVLHGNGKGHFTNVFMRPIPLKPQETKVIYGVVCSADSQEEACALCRETMEQKKNFDSVWKEVSKSMAPVPVLQEGERFSLGQQLMQAVLCTNVVYPVYTRGQYIRHNTPGRWWDSLYTWDSGFTGMGLTQFSVRRGFDCLNAYLTYPGDDEAAFIHHGSLVPTQFYLFAELWNRTGSRELMEYCYPRLLQYYHFLSGQVGSSTTGNLRSGLLRPWDYFYNSGGWDDYPPQRATHEQQLDAVCTPVITTAHAVRCARILAYAADLLGKKEDQQKLLEDVKNFADALNQHAWDEESGYYGYVLHNSQGIPEGIFRDDSGVNYNMGLGGASPLFAGVCSSDQAEGLWNKLETEGRLWTSCGLSTVDQTAPYYRRDGYWNGAVWMPYQWMFFKTALDAGRTDFAFRLADTLLKLWQDECAASYHCFEHFMIESRRGAGWHQFGGLSAPIVQFYASYYRPGTLTTGFDTFVREAKWSEDCNSLEAWLDCTRAGRMAILAVTGGKAGTVKLSVTNSKVCRRYDGMWEIIFEIAEPQSVALQIW